VIVFGGAFFEPAALEFLALLDQHPEVELLGGFCQSRGFSLRARVEDVARRRGLLALPVLGLEGIRGALRVVLRPRAEWTRRRRVRLALARIHTVPDIHAPAVLNHVRTLAADLGLVYGAPILKPALFEIPTFGTFGLHHGKLPSYRGKKTTFWAMYNGDTAAGVTIQRINAGLDTGEIVSAGTVPIGRKGYRRVSAEVQQLGLRLYLESVVAMKRGEAFCVEQPSGHSPVYRQPCARDILRLWYRQLFGLPEGR